MACGRLFYVIGASGSGKDSLLRYARASLREHERVMFAHRYITRPPELEGENHVYLSEQEFAERLAAGLFAMHWDSHGYRYGIGCEIDTWLAKGYNVAVNGSREYLHQAFERYPEMLAILIDTPPAVLEARLKARGRESAEEITERLERAKAFGSLSHPRLLRVDNSATIEEAGERLVALLTGACAEAPCA
ncbi:phosphonate metabolism protein/1,5-bisphosphokinase (PRPP-forming) PhnN [Methylococcus sp. Mc7]|uniref:phosphonate metabolism protein/1,5-bisphosphokinase (PRPP-forming) PhnN n=1 Tax=Methylococcus sp. Mc7 TaxID=2860258 RepID=UPI001C52E895|nr:phosphonate metabolism protein/1,5-bisphosphokinase (PRPP-forming) PhnN [Methylococcus sp. Mc7]QXP85097.1 phosphonate metabolism protein/1,5-bisphosphokinase (PRPP-forming) PhnN [Methylococcus sp. Mc7]